MTLIGLEGRFERLKWPSISYIPAVIIIFGLGIGEETKPTQQYMNAWAIADLNQ